MQVLYTLYDKDEQLIATGRAGQIASGQQINVDTFHSIVNRVKNGKCTKYVIYIEYYGSDQDPDADGSVPVSWDLYDPRSGEVNEQHSDQGSRQEKRPGRMRPERPEGTMADALRKLGIFTF